MSEDKIAVQCPGCGKEFATPVSNAGKKGRCPCGATFIVPDVDGDAGPTFESDRTKARREAAEEGKRKAKEAGKKATETAKKAVETAKAIAASPEMQKAKEATAAAAVKTKEAAAEAGRKAQEAAVKTKDALQEGAHKVAEKGAAVVKGAMQPRRLAKGAMICGVLSLILPILAAIPALILGLVAWKRPTAGGKDKALAALGILMGICFSALTITLLTMWQASITREMHRAHALYESGKTAEAIAIYKKQAELTTSEEDAAKAYSRLIDAAATEGYQDEANSYAEKAFRARLTLRPETEVGKYVVAELKRQRELERQRQEREREVARQEAEKAGAEKQGGEQYIKNYRLGYAYGLSVRRKIGETPSGSNIDKAIAAGKGREPSLWAKPGFEEGVRDGIRDKMPRYK